MKTPGDRGTLVILLGKKGSLADFGATDELVDSQSTCQNLRWPSSPTVASTDPSGDKDKSHTPYKYGHQTLHNAFIHTSHAPSHELLEYNNSHTEVAL